MSHFGTHLKTLMERKQISGAKLARLSGVDDSKISRYLSGDQKWVSPDHMEKIVKAISNDPQDQAELLRAHLYDECTGLGSELIEIRITGREQSAREIAAPYRTPIPLEAEQDFATLREWYIKDKNVREIIEGTANLLRSGDVRTHEELRTREKKSASYPTHTERTEIIHEEPPPPASTVPRRKEPKAGLTREEQQ